MLDLTNNGNKSIKHPALLVSTNNQSSIIDNQLKGEPNFSYTHPPFYSSTLLCKTNPIYTQTAISACATKTYKNIHPDIRNTREVYPLRPWRIWLEKNQKNGKNACVIACFLVIIHKF
jgi:hypothetical protein